MDDTKPHVAALVVAAGRGTRAGGPVPKQWQRLGTNSVAEITIAKLLDHARIDSLVLVLHADDLDSSLWPRDPRITAVAGGATRGESVVAGLNALPDGVAQVLIHDVARPLVDAATIDAVLDALATHDGAAPGLAVTDALWTGQKTVTGSLPRDGLYRAQTPQGFHRAAITAAHANFTGDPADDVQVARAAGLTIAIVPGSEDNIKITRPEDFGRASRLLGGTMNIRFGHGYDVHRFGPGDHVTLCGVDVPFDRGLQGHSDADVGMHALTDAIYGALAEGDIGRHFPPSDPQWKGAASWIFLDHAVKLATDKGYKLQNVDVTLICEFPKIGPLAAAMSERLADIMGLDKGQISVKATTSERLGFTGRGEGIAAMATALLVGA